MRAVILAGGLGTRLRPLTYHVPKPLVTLVDRPLIMHIIDSLPTEVDAVILAVNYMCDRLEEYFSNVDVGREIILVEENEPLGTGGALKNLSQHLDDTFLAFNGDVVSSLDLRKLVAHHRHAGGIGTLALWKVPDPSAFGVVRLEGDRITDFQEKPAPGEAVSDLINAGMYVFEPELLDHIPDGKASIEREVFPEVLDHGLHGHRFQGYWVDCGTLPNYIRAQTAILASTGRENYLRGQAPEGLVRVCSEPGSTIQIGAMVQDSMVFSGAIVEPGAIVERSIVGPGVRVKAGTLLEDTIVA